MDILNSVNVACTRARGIANTTSIIIFNIHIGRIMTITINYIIMLKKKLHYYPWLHPPRHHARYSVTNIGSTMTITITFIVMHARFP
jgi:hypothetical protein